MSGGLIAEERARGTRYSTSAIRSLVAGTTRRGPSPSRPLTVAARRRASPSARRANGQRPVRGERADARAAVPQLGLDARLVEPRQRDRKVNVERPMLGAHLQLRVVAARQAEGERTVRRLGVQSRPLPLAPRE